MCATQLCPPGYIWSTACRTARKSCFATSSITPATAHDNLHVSITVTQPDAHWHGLTGRIDPVKLHALDVPDDTLYYLCGPKGMVEDMSTLLHDLGVPMNRIIFEKWW